MQSRQSAGLLGMVWAFLSPRSDRTVGTNDVQSMNEAIAQAIDSLPVFWEWLDQHQETNEPRALKVRFDTVHGPPEFIWLSDIRRTGPFATGIVSNRPEAVAGLQEGEIVPVDPDRIVDWTFRQNGLDYGHFTTRVLAIANPVLARRLKDVSETPLPDQVRP